MAGGLGRSKVAAVTEDGEEIAPHGVGELRIGPGWRSKVSRIARPVLGGLENIEQMAFGHPVADFLLEGCQLVRGAVAGCRFRCGTPSASKVSSAFPGKPSSTVLAAFVSWALMRATKSSPVSGIPSPAQ